MLYAKGCSQCSIDIYNVPIFFNELIWSSLWLTFTPHFEMKDPYTFLNTFFGWKRINCYTLLYRFCLYSEFDQTAMPYYNISEQTIIRCFCDQTGMCCSRDRMQLVPIANIVFILATVVMCNRYNLMGWNLLLDCVRSDFPIVLRHRPPIKLTRYIAEIQYCWICEDTYCWFMRIFIYIDLHLTIFSDWKEHLPINSGFSEINI